MNHDTKESDNGSTGLIGILVIYLGLFLFAYTVPLANPAKAAIMETLGLKEEADTWPLFTSYFLAWLIIVPPGAFLADRFGRKTMLLAGSLALTAGMLLLSVSQTLPMACVAHYSGKKSGVGRLGGRHTLEEMTQTKCYVFDVGNPDT